MLGASRMISYATRHPTLWPRTAQGTSASLDPPTRSISLAMSVALGMVGSRERLARPGYCTACVQGGAPLLPSRSLLRCSWRNDACDGPTIISTRFARHHSNRGEGARRVPVPSDENMSSELPLLHRHRSLMAGFPSGTCK